MSYNELDTLKKMPSTYSSWNSSYINKWRHSVRVQLKGKTSCWLCKKRMSINLRSTMFCMTAHRTCIKIHRKKERRLKQHAK